MSKAPKQTKSKADEPSGGADHATADADQATPAERSGASADGSGETDRDQQPSSEADDDHGPADDHDPAGDETVSDEAVSDQPTATSAAAAKASSDDDDDDAASLEKETTKPDSPRASRHKLTQPSTKAAEAEAAEAEATKPQAAKPAAGPNRTPLYLALAALAVGLGGYGWHSHQQKLAAEREANLVSNCKQDSHKAACDELCRRTPPDAEACLIYAKALDEAGNDTARVTDLFTQACDAGNMEGCARLGRVLLNAKGEQHDEKRAAELFNKACTGGNPLGCAGRGHLLLLGLGGVKKDEKAGFALAEQSCGDEEPRGCTLLATAFLNGVGTKRNPA